MDGVSIAASIIGIGAAGSQIAIKLYTLATQISTASDRISSISNDVFSTSAVLQQLGELMTTTSMHDGTTIFSQGGLDTTRTSAAMCETIFKDIEHAAREASEQLRGRSRFTGGKIKLSRSERLKWPFLQPSIDTLRNDLREAKSTLMLMLHITLLAFSKKMAEIHQTTSKNIVEQREIIDAILVYQKQQHSSQRVEAQAQPLSSSSFGGDNLKAVISNTDGETSSRADENSTLAQCRSSDPATLLPLRLNNVLMAMPPPKTLITKTTSMKSASSRIGQSITADGDACDPQSNYEDHTVSASGQSSLRGGGVITPTESTVGKDAEGIHNLTFFLMKPIIKDLGEVIQLSWKVHNLQMQQTKIRNQVIENEKDGLPLVHEVCQGLYAHEHAALEGLISRASAGSNVSLQSLKRIYIDMKHRDILFKGVPGLEFVLERTVQQPVPQTSLSMEAQAAASAPLQPSGSAYGKKVRLEEFLNDTNIGSWADEMDDVQPAAPTRSPVKDNKPEVNELKDEKRSRSTAAARKFRERREAQHEARTAELDIWKQRAADNGWREEGHASQGNQRRMASDTVELSGSEVASVWANKMDHTLIDASSEKPPEHRKTPLSGSSATRKIDIDRYKRARNAISAPLQDLNWKTASEPQLDPRETQDTELQSKDHGALLSVGTLRRKPVKMGISWQAGLAYKTSSQALEDEPGSQDHLAGFSGLEGLETNERPGKVTSSRRCHLCNKAETPEGRRDLDRAGTLCDACGKQEASGTMTMRSESAIKTNGLHPVLETRCWDLVDQKSIDVSAMTLPVGDEKWKVHGLHPAALRLETSRPVSSTDLSPYLTSLRSARPIKSTGAISYPDGIVEVRLHGAIDQSNQWVRYDVPFLLQFQHVVTETPVKADIRQRMKGVKMQPVTSDETIMRFRHRAADMETMSRAATWGTRRPSESDSERLFRRFSKNNDEGRLQGERRGSFFEPAAAKLLPRRSQSIVKEPYRVTGRRLKSPRIDTASAVAAMAGQIASIGTGQGDPATAGGSLPPTGPWKNIVERNRSRNDLQANRSTGNLADPWTKQGGPPMPTLRVDSFSFGSRQESPAVLAPQRSLSVGKRPISPRTDAGSAVVKMAGQIAAIGAGQAGPAKAREHAQGIIAAELDVREDDNDSEDNEEISSQVMNEKEADRVVTELLGRYTTLFQGRKAEVQSGGVL